MRETDFFPVRIIQLKQVQVFFLDQTNITPLTFLRKNWELDTWLMMKWCLLCICKSGGEGSSMGSCSEDPAWTSTTRNF